VMSQTVEGDIFVMVDREMATILCGNMWSNYLSEVWLSYQNVVDESILYMYRLRRIVLLRHQSHPRVLPGDDVV
jgi:hypothetical protein